jgi:hypothetical protein
MGSELSTGFDCSVCGLHHDVLPLSYSVKVPLAALRVPPEEVDERVAITPDQCVIDNREFYLRGRIPVPVHGLAEPFIWGVWAEVGPKDFIRTNEMWAVEGREGEPAFKGYLDSEMYVFGDTVNLEVMVETQVVGRRPHFRVCDPEHPLAREQRDGISMERVVEIAEMVLHRGE